VFAELNKYIEQAPPGELPGLIGRLEEFKARAWARLNQPAAGPVSPILTETVGGLVDIHEAARLLGMSTSWLYRNASTFPFVVKLNGRNLRFNVNGMEKWLRDRARG